MQSFTIDRPYTLGQLGDYVNTCLMTGYAHFLIPIASYNNTEDQEENAEEVRVWFRNVFKPLLLHLMQSRAIRSLRIECEFLSPQIFELLAHWIWLNQPQFKEFHYTGFFPTPYYHVYKDLSNRAEYINFVEKAIESPYVALMGNSYLESITYFYYFNKDFELDPDDGFEVVAEMRDIPMVSRPNIFQFLWDSYEYVNDDNYQKPTHEQLDIDEDDESVSDYDGNYMIEYNPDDKRYEQRYTDLGQILYSHPSLTHINLYSHPENDDIGDLDVFDKLLFKKNLRSLHLLKVNEDRDIFYIHNLCLRRNRIRGAQPLEIHFYKTIDDVEHIQY